VDTEWAEGSEGIAATGQREVVKRFTPGAFADSTKRARRAGLWHIVPVGFSQVLTARRTRRDSAVIADIAGKTGSRKALLRSARR
jgi:hypothetical protein